MKDLVIHDHLVIPASELEVSYARSGGPGGQNVNKVNSKVIIRWELQNSTALDMVVSERLRRLAGSRLNDDGSIQVTSQEHRDQAANLRTCLLKLQKMIVQALQTPKVRKQHGPQQARFDAACRTKPNGASINRTDRSAIGLDRSGRTHPREEKWGSVPKSG